eukprot:3859159-Rhodomonas_salina.3
MVMWHAVVVLTGAMVAGRLVPQHQPHLPEAGPDPQLPGLLLDLPPTHAESVSTTDRADDGAARFSQKSPRK